MFATTPSSDVRPVAVLLGGTGKCQPAILRPQRDLGALLRSVPTRHLAADVAVRPGVSQPPACVFRHG